MYLYIVHKIPFQSRIEEFVVNCITLKVLKVNVKE